MKKDRYPFMILWKWLCIILNLGYYTSSPDKIGKHGDYYTSPYLTNIFGNVIAKQLEEMWL